MAMYSSMWSKTGRHRAPRVAAMPRIRLEAGSRTLHIHDMRNYPMFRQPPGRVICSTHPPDGWLQAVPSSPLMHPGRRVAFYFDEDALWYPATVVVRQGCSALLRFDDERWPDLDAEDSMCFHLSVLASGSSDVHPPLPMTQPDQSGLYLSLSESGYQGVFRANTTGSKSLQGPNPWCARIRILGQSGDTSGRLSNRSCCCCRICCGAGCAFCPIGRTAAAIVSLPTAGPERSQLDRKSAH